MSAPEQVGQVKTLSRERQAPHSAVHLARVLKNLLLHLVLSPQKSCALPRGKGVSVWSPLDRSHDHLYSETPALAFQAPPLSHLYLFFTMVFRKKLLMYIHSITLCIMMMFSRMISCAFDHIPHCSFWSPSSLTGPHPLPKQSFCLCTTQDR